jgi:predicted transcriptional regulator
MSEPYNLTPVELELMDILWKIGQGTVRDVMHHLSVQRTLAYTSVSTILRILQQKKIITVEKLMRQHIYLPILSKETFVAYSVKRIISQFFAGDSVQIFSYLMNKSDLTQKEIGKIQILLDARKKETA